MYISVTGLRLNAFWHIPLFWRHAFPSMAAAKAAPGNIMADGRTTKGVHHTLSAWEAKSDMLAYLRSPAHAKAIRRFPGIATGRVHGFEADAVPGWDDALKAWHDLGRDVYRGR